ncbi:tRNA glutamyl-Q(34) synthetase GluQRS [Aeromicrobium sp.]|uniref:tRNA glutamyl-Q(34) synthetase GluQRS n=1 Tax=Aeromicrobium sp. TaxID=1871063 RepID=UPI003C46A1FE
MSAGRFAPSPSGDLHIGNLRTALLAWLWARHSERGFLLRIEDLDRVRPGAEAKQLADLRAIGLTWDEEPVRQSARHALYDSAISGLVRAGRVYECFCSRREILQAPTAPHSPPGAYPGTCRELTTAQRSERRRHRPAALRLRSHVATFVVRDEIHGEFEGAVDDFVLRRGDGVPSYNLAVVVDDADQGIDQVVRGDDLLASAPRQAYLAGLLGAAVPQYVHVPLALNAAGRRLAKRDGAVTLEQLRSHGVDVFGLLAESWGLRGASPHELLRSFNPTVRPVGPWVFAPPASAR